MDPVIIQQLAQLSPGDEEVTLVENRLELLTQKKIICHFDNFRFGMGENFQIEIDQNGSRNSSTWKFSLTHSSSSGGSIFKYNRFNDGRTTYYSNTETNVWHCVDASILDSNGVKMGKTFKSDLCAYTSYNEMEIFHINKNTFDLPIISPGNGCLVVDATLKIFRKMPVAKKTLDKNGSASDASFGSAVVMKDKPRAGFRSFLNSKDLSDVKLISNDGKEFHAHKVILSVGSEVFEAMFKADMTESKTGIVKVDDLSSEVVNFLLAHIYCGDILPLSFNGEKLDGVFRDPDAEKPSGSQAPIELKDALNVASKYRLEQVLFFIDRSIRRLCSEENAMELFELSRLHSLDCKEVIRDFIKCHPRIWDSILKP